MLQENRAIYLYSSASSMDFIFFEFNPPFFCKRKSRLKSLASKSISDTTFEYCLHVLYGLSKNKDSYVEKKNFIPSTILLQRYLKDGIPEIFLEEEGRASRNTLEYFKMGVIMELLSMCGHNMRLFRQHLVQEISSLNQKEKESYQKKLYELEVFFTYL